MRRAGRLGGALLLAAASLAAACAREPGDAAGGVWRFADYDLSLRLPEGWTAEGIYTLYARRMRVSESEARALPVPELVRRMRLLLVAHPPPASGASAHCVLTVEAEDLSRYPNVNSVEAYAELAERAARRSLSGYERVEEDRRTLAGRGPAIRRGCRALQTLAGEASPVRNLTLFILKGTTGIAVGAYEIEDRFEARRQEFEAILGSVRIGPPEPSGAWERFVRWLSGVGG